MASESPTSVKEEDVSSKTEEGLTVGAEDLRTMKEVVENLTNYKKEE